MPAKKAQRTKGNVKPSSSSQAAQLLAASGQAPSGFIGFSSQPAFVPASEIFEECDSNLDADFRLVLRKFSKRDTTTKIKALHEFCSLCGTKDEECVKAVVPFWPRIYNKLAIDVDHKVRELSQTALSVLAARAGKSIAPQLKTIMGSWLVSQCDTYPTVASAATSAFEATFSGAKQGEALRFCKTEIMQCLLSNVLKQTPQTLSDPLTTSQEDMESKYLRVVSSSLQAIRKLMSGLTAESLGSLTPQLSELLSSGAFWKHAKSTIPMVKTGVLSVLSAVCQLCPDVSALFLAKICPLVVSCLNSSDPSLMAQSWEAILSVAHTHNNCWDHVNWQKAVWPSLKGVLENGCSGQATVISPCLLPLLSTLPEKNFEQFFSAFRLGLNEDSVLNSPSACAALVRSFFECLQYSLKFIAGSASDENKLPKIKSITEDQMIVVVQASLTHPKPALSRTELYSLIGTVLSTLCDLDPREEDTVWSDLSAFIVSHLVLQFKPPAQDGEKEVKKPSPQIFQRLFLLARGIVYQETVSTSKRERVRFVQKEKEPSGKSGVSIPQKQQMSSAAENFYSDLLVASYTMASLEGPMSSQYFNLFKELTIIHIPSAAPERLLQGRKDSTVRLILCDLGLSDSYSLPQHSPDWLAEELKSVPNVDQGGRSDAYWSFLCDHLVGQLAEAAKGFNGEGASVHSDVVATFFAFVSYVEEEKGAELLLTILNKLQQPVAVCHFIEELLGLAKRVPACQQLVKGPAIGARIERLTTDLMADPDALSSPEVSGALWEMLTAAISLTEENSWLLVSESCLDAIVSSYIATLKQFLTSHVTATGDNVMSVVRMAQAAFDKHKLASHPQLCELVMSLMSIQLQTYDWDQDAETEFASVLEAGLRLMLQSDAPAEKERRLESMCAQIQQWLRESVTSVAGLSRVTKAVRILAVAAAGGSGNSEYKDSVDLQKESSTSPSLDVSVLASVKNNLLVDVQQLCVPEEQKVMECLYAQGRLHQRPKSKESRNDETLVTLQPYALLCVHNLRTLNLIAELTEGDNDAVTADTSFTEKRLLCLTSLAFACLVVRTAEQMKSFSPSESSIILEELESGVKSNLMALTEGQMSQVLQSSPKGECFSQRQTLDVVKLLTEKETIPTGVSDVFRRTELQLLLRLVDPEVEKEVKDLLVLPVTGDGICKAFNLATGVAVGRDEASLETMSDCMCGFVELAKDLDVMTEEVKVALFQQLTEIVKELKDKGIHLLTGGDADCSKEHMHLNTCIARTLPDLMVSHSEQFWEFCLCVLVEWIQYLSEIDASSWSNDVTRRPLLVSVCQLSDFAAHTFASAPVMKEMSLEAPPNCVTEKAKTEWEEFFCEGIFSPLLHMFVTLAASDQATSCAENKIMLAPLSMTIVACPISVILKHQLPARLTVSDTSVLPDSLKTLLNHLSPLLMSRQRCVQLASYHLLSRVIEDVPRHEPPVGEENKEEEEMRSPPEALVQLVESTSHYLDALMVASVEEQVEMERGSEESAQARGYMLAWTLLLQLFRCSPNLLRAKYAGYFKSRDSVNHLLDHLFRLVPSQVNTPLLEFSLDQDAAGEGSSEELSGLALSVYRRCLETLPALVRVWWVDQDRKSSNFVDRFTSQYLSKDLILHQISASNNPTTNMEGITIRARPAAREVSATYEMAEVSVTLTITLPENFPLGRLNVACDRRVGVSQGQWDRWLMQLNIFLQHQNGSIEEGLRLWKGNIDKKFEGIDDCMICFSVIHGTTFQLPRLTCKTCHKKFHSACLYKWFSTSQKSSCPLCRNLF